MAVVKVSTLSFLGFLSGMFGALLLAIGLPEDHLFAKRIPVRVINAEIIDTKDPTARFAFRACWEWVTIDSTMQYCGNPHFGNIRVKYRQSAEDLRQEILQVDTGGFCKGLDRPVLFEEKMDPFERRVYSAAPYAMLIISAFMFGTIFLMLFVAWKASNRAKGNDSP